MLGRKTAKNENIEGNFLSRTRIDEEREFIRYNTKLNCKIQNFKGIRCQPPINAMVRNISQGGAFLEIGILAVKGQHIYLNLDNYPFRIGAAVVEVQSNGYNLKFIKKLGKKVTERIAKGLPYNSVLASKDFK